ncbi:MAG: hypothetical protein NT157_04885 [Candidatus Micrarchaeota archaeon]|nr:hypothetical protein [Candidatus Micrarchaeota archaeon]
MPKKMEKVEERGPKEEPSREPNAEPGGELVRGLDGAGGSGEGTAKGPNEAREEHTKGPRPDFRVVQTEQTLEGETRFMNVGGMWRNVSRNGNEFYTMRIRPKH